GGVLLGTSGLITAYKTASREALQNAVHVEKLWHELIKIRVDYLKLNKVLSYIKSLQIKIVAQTYTETHSHITLSVPQSSQAEYCTIFELDAIVKKMSRSISILQRTIYCIYPPNSIR
ncbi:MAG: hypothetical protein ACRC3G_08515, partial [Bacteroidales bacterium]